MTVNMGVRRVMLESEACEKWCPAAIVSDPVNGGSTNRAHRRYKTDPVKAHEDCCCLGSECVAWVEEGVRMTDEGMRPSGRCGWVKRG
jgi:hypothetical protein